MNAPKVRQFGRHGLWLCLFLVFALPSLAQEVTKAQADRLAILTQEQSDVRKRLALEKAQKEPDQAAIARLEADLVSLEKEISFAQKQPSYEAKISVPKTATPATATPTAKLVARPAPVASPSSPSESEAAFENWDIFKNFGRKGKP